MKYRIRCILKTKTHYLSWYYTKKLLYNTEDTFNPWEKTDNNIFAQFNLIDGRCVLSSILRSADFKSNDYYSFILERIK